MKNFLITQGCTGTYSLIGAVGKHFNYENTRSFNHHSRNANNGAFTKESNVVYIFCNPYDYVLSCFRRWKNTDGVRSHNQQCGGDNEYYVSKNYRGLEDFLSDPYDCFKYKEHADGYLHNDQRKYNLLFVKYEVLSEYGIQPILDFWNLSNDPNCFKFKQRSSNWKNESQEIKDLLEFKYGDVMKWYEELPLTQTFECS
jgi:hypothetical protein